MKKLRVLITISFAAILMPFAIQAQEANCQNPQTTLEMKICAGQELTAADGVLNANYSKARDYMREIDDNLTGELAGAEIALRDAQRAWIKFRDGACVAEGFPVRGGTLESVLVISCLARLTNQRADDLTRLFKPDL